MAKQSLTTIKNWFRTRLKPTQAQYWDTWDSFWHKDQKIPTSTIENLDEILVSKASQEYVQNVEYMMVQLTSDTYVETADLDDDALLTLTRTNNQEPLPVQFAKVAKTGSYSDLSDKPTIAGQVQSDWNQQTNTEADFIKNKPTIPAVQVQSDWNQATNTEADFIKNKPTIPAAQVQSDWNQATNTEADFIKNKPTLGSMASKNFWTGTQAAYDLIDPKDANTIYHVEEE